MDKISRPVPGSNTVMTNRFFQVCFAPEDEGAGGDEPGFDFANPTEALSPDKGAQILGEALAEKPDNRDPATGRFKDTDKAEVEDDTKVVDLKTGKPPEAKVEDQEAVEDEDPVFEFEPEEEGKDPVTRKLSELVAGFEKAATLEQEVETLRTQATQVPAEYATGLQQAVEARGTYLKGLEFVSMLFNPQPPNVAMLDPNSQHYDPDGYRSAYQAFEQQRAAVEKIKTDHATASKEQEEQQKTLMGAYLAREREALFKAWPEAKSPETAKKVSETLKQHYGFTDDEIKNTNDHRMFLVIRDAMEFRASKAKEAEAVKVVRKLPKLVKGAARTTTDSKAAGRSSAMSRLAQTGSIHDAVQAVKGLI